MLLLIGENGETSAKRAWKLSPPPITTEQSEEDTKGTRSSGQTASSTVLLAAVYAIHELDTTVTSESIRHNLSGTVRHGATSSSSATDY